jgi:hypothetical protein
MAYLRASWMIASALSLPLFIGGVAAQTCDSLLGNTNCNIATGKTPTLPPDRESDWNFSYADGRGFGTDLLTGRGNDDAAMLGGIVFGGGGATCMGPFRSRRC